MHALAWSLPDVQPAPKVAKSGAASGEVANAWHLCESCDGQGFGRDKFGRETACLLCSGKGRFRVDSMTGGRVSTAEHSAPARTRRVLCDRCGGSGVMPGRYVGETGMVRCDPCDGAGKVSVPAVPGQEPAVVAFDGTARSRLRARGDWDALELAIAELGPVRRQWIEVRVDGLTNYLTDEVLAAIDQQLLERLPDPLRCPRDVMTAFEHRQERAAAREAARLAKRGRGSKRARAAELLRMGYSTMDAARIAGVSRQTAWRAGKA